MEEIPDDGIGVAVSQAGEFQGQEQLRAPVARDPLLEQVHGWCTLAVPPAAPTTGQSLSEHLLLLPTRLPISSYPSARNPQKYFLHGPASIDRSIFAFSPPPSL